MSTQDPTLGRVMLFTDEPKITKENIAKVVSTAYAQHIQWNAPQEEKLLKYKKGDQPILARVKDIRPEINVHVLENNAAKIVEIHMGYDFANPITFAQRERKEIDKEDDGGLEDSTVSQLNKMMLDQNKATKDIEMANFLFSTGLGYQIVLPSRDKDSYSPFELATLNPLTTFVVYSNDAFREPMLAATYFEREDGTVVCTAWSKDHFYKLQMGVASKEFAPNPITLPNPIGAIPVIEFALTDRQAIFEKVIPLLDALNIVGSDRVNSIIQFVQSILWFHNCQLDEEATKEIKNGDKPSAIIFTKNDDGKQASIKYISEQLDQAQTQNLVDYYQSQILQITSTPSWQEASGGSTTGAMQLSNGWQCLEISAKIVEMLFDASERRLLKVIKKIIEKDTTRDYLTDIKNMDIADIEVKFARNKTYDLVSKTNSLVSLLNAGVDGLTAFTTVSLFTDPQAAWCDSKSTIEGMQKKLSDPDPKPSETTNAIPNANAAMDENGNGGVNNTEKDPTEAALQPSKVAGVSE